MTSIYTAMGEIQAKSRYTRSQGAFTMLGIWNNAASRWQDLGTNFKAQVGDGSLEMAIPLALIRPALGGEAELTTRLHALNEDANGNWLTNLETDPRTVSFDF